MRADRTASRARAAVVLGVLLSGCAGSQSALDPAGPAAASIHTLGMVMYVGAAVVTLLVTVLMLVPFWRRRARPVNRRLFLWGGGVALPLLTLTALVPYVLTVGHETSAGTAAVTPLTIDVTGHLWWWQVRYRHADGVSVVSANELRLPAGTQVELVLQASDVIHSLWIPNLAGKVDMIPGRTNRLRLQADRVGVYRGQCAEYCGRQHANMAFDVVVMPPAEFDAWMHRRAQPPRAPATAQLRQGQRLFIDLGCGACHTIDGVSAGSLGPDLTHVGSRRTLGAGTLPGGVGNLAAWIASAQHLKPGVAMPSYDRLEGPQLPALAAYLASLK